jgi:thiol-disulfide isomerase/thioredoxin
MRVPFRLPVRGWPANVPTIDSIPLPAKVCNSSVAPVFELCNEWGYKKADEVTMSGLLQISNRLTVTIAVVACMVGASLTRAQTPDIIAAVQSAKLAAIQVKPLVFTVLDGETARPVAGAKVSSAYFVRPGTALEPKPEELVTDENGKVTLHLPEGVMQNLGISVVHSNYAARQVVMQSDGNPIASVPGEYTVQLRKGVAVGGFVRDEKGQAIAGGKVLVWGYGGNNMQPRTRGFFEISSVNRDETNATITDAKGFWVHEQVPTDLENLLMDVIRPTGAVSRFGTASREQLSFENITPVSLAALRATNAVLTLKEGVTITGLVTDASGKTVSNARIRERGARNGYGVAFSFVNQTDGRFELKNREAMPFLLTAEADGFAISSTVVTPAAGMKEVRLVLSPAVPLKLRVVGEKDEPVTGAEVKPIDWRARNHVLDWKGKTDEQGKVTWPNAPTNEVSYYVTSTNYPVRAVRVTADGKEHVVALRKDTDKSVDVKVKATDAESGQPIGKFTVLKGPEYNEQFVALGEPGKDGAFQSKLTEADLRQGYGATYRLQVRAEGYTPWTSDTVYVDEGPQELAVKLIKGVPPAGMIVQQDGQPAEKALVILNTGRNSVYLYDSREPYLQPGMSSRKTGADGKFLFEAADPESRLVVIHPRGFVTASVEELKRTPELRLQPWGSVEGVVQVAGKPKANERVSLRYPLSWTDVDNYNLHYSTATDAQGKFTFTNLPAGKFLLYRQPQMRMGPITESHRWVVDVKPGEVTQVAYSFGGRTVVGHVESGASVDWQNDAQVLVLSVGEQPPAPMYYGFGDNKAFEKARRQHAQSPEVQAYEAKKKQFQLVFQTDGDFRVEDVPPGKYELRLRVTKPPENRNSPRSGGNEQVIGTLVREVTIPPGKDGEELDLGNFELEVKEQRFADAAPLSLQAVTLDGKPFDLASLRGKPVVLTFWAKWAPKSKEQLEVMRTAQTEMRGVPFVTVNLDEDVATAKSGVGDLSGTDWVHTRLAGAARADVTEELTIDALPLTLLLDDKGRPVSRDLTGTRLRAAVKRLNAKTAKK